MWLVLVVSIPLVAGLLCLAVSSRSWWERLNLCAFIAVAGLLQASAQLIGGAS